MDDSKNEDVIEITDETVEDGIVPHGDALLDSVLEKQAAKPKDEALEKKKKDFIKYGSIAGAFLVLLLVLFSCQSSKGPMEYGVCSVFLEMNTPYPHTLRYNAVEGSRTSIRIYYTSVDPFGQYKEEMIECKFRSDKWELVEVSKNRRVVNSEEVRKFNILIPTIIENDPDLSLPPNWKNPLLK